MNMKTSVERPKECREQLEAMKDLKGLLEELRDLRELVAALVKEREGRRRGENAEVCQPSDENRS